MGFNGLNVTPKWGLLVRSIMNGIYGGIHPPNILALTEKLCGGSMTIDSRFDEGTRIVIRIPVGSEYGVNGTEET